MAALQCRECIGSKLDRAAAYVYSRRLLFLVKSVNDLHVDRKRLGTLQQEPTSVHRPTATLPLPDIQGQGHRGEGLIGTLQQQEPK